MKINHFSHEHELTLFQKTEENFKQVSEKVAKLYVESDAEISSDSEGYEEDESTKLPKCNGCYETIQGPAYFCETCEDFWLHNSCASLSRELSDHPSHPSHTLALLANPPNPHVSRYSRFQNPRIMFFICHECRDFCRGFGYHCKKCRINLDVKCALSAKPGNQIPAQADKRAEISHFSHTDHRLLLFNFTKEFKDLIGYGEYCSGCGARHSHQERSIVALIVNSTFTKTLQNCHRNSIIPSIQIQSTHFLSNLSDMARICLSVKNAETFPRVLKPAAKNATSNSISSVLFSSLTVEWFKDRELGKT
ncbi:hypothetical protein K2173_015112 [Erythroxylum novogranatense]|uniref:DC1 domain-containing protein n=1 Tax=Erythroxylum novogranatense TaxID=1862640 RepID=A0AAV8T2F8_9ROSI|nr:hypothetical protein K2173_015112 [Erythroxylum novogranatense]